MIPVFFCLLNEILQNNTQLGISDTLIIKTEDYVPLHVGGSFISGQEQDAKAIFDDSPFEPIFDRTQGLSGSLTQVELWNTILSPAEIERLANCQIATLRPKNRVITWGSNAWDAKEINFKEVKLIELCEQNLVFNQLIWPRAIDFNTFNSYCQAMDGKVSMHHVERAFLSVLRVPDMLSENRRQIYSDIWDTSKSFLMKNS